MFRKSITLGLCLAAVVIFACSKPEQPAAPGPSSRPQVPTSPSSSAGPSPSSKPQPVADVSGRDLGTFDHTSPKHKGLPCKTCHERKTNDLKPRLPEHPACIQCHSDIFPNEKFTQRQQFCQLCHTWPIGPGAVTAIDFPNQMKQFGIKEFSHRDHLDRSKMPSSHPELTCDSCHRLAGGTIQVGFPGHAECYTCHTPEDQKAGGDCGVCHGGKEQAIPFRTRTRLAFLKFGFQHSSHLKQRQIAGDCTKCHQSVSPVGLVDTAGDISGISPRFGMRHSSRCWTCHVQEKEPTCTKCHREGPPLSIAYLSPSAGLVWENRYDSAEFRREH